MKKIFLTIFIVTIIIMASCESHTYDEISKTTTDPTELVSYTKDVAPILASKCTSCHTTGQTTPYLETYTFAKNGVSTGEVLCKIQGSCGSVMPPTGKMEQSLIDKITKWKTDGYQN